MKKRILAVIMAVCVSMTALPADVRAAEDSAVQTESTQKTSPSEKSAQTENTGNAAEELTGTEMAETEEAAETEETAEKCNPKKWLAFLCFVILGTVKERRETYGNSGSS